MDISSRTVSLLIPVNFRESIRSLFRVFAHVQAQAVKQTFHQVEFAPLYERVGTAKAIGSRCAVKCRRKGASYVRRMPTISSRLFHTRRMISTT